MAAVTIGAPQQMVMAGPGEDIFRGSQKLFVKQEIAAIELCGIEAKQRYRISVPSGDGRHEGPEVFLYITEKSECVERVCCSHNRGLLLEVHQGGSKEGPVLMRMQKPFHCGGCCPCLRPSFAVTGASGEPLGTVEDPCKCCVMDQRILDKTGSELFRTAGCACQLGMLCPCCADVTFDVTSQGAPEGTKVGEINKMAMDCEELFLKTNRFVVDFGAVADPEQKKLLFAAAMLLDLEYFESQK